MRPRGVPEASRRRPRMSKKRPGGAKLDFVVFYNVFKRLYSSKRDPEGIPPTCVPEASQKRPDDSQERRRSVQEAQSSIYSCFIGFSSDPGPPGGMGRRALVTYRLGRLTELNLHIYPTSLHTLENRPWSSTHWCARGQGADSMAKASCRRPPKIQN